MNKKAQIEEVAEIICADCRASAGIYECISEKRPCESAIVKAQKIINAGYTKKILGESNIAVTPGGDITKAC